MALNLDTLQNGIRVITQAVQGVETVSLGIWLPRGSRDEQISENGMFHFIEHTLFKGTPSRSARDIAEIIEGFGGILDAYTAKEETCYSLRVRHVHLEAVLEVLADMLVNPAFREDELDRERKVILEEIKMEEDNPEEVVYEHAVGRFWKDHAISRPILGSAENVSSFNAEQVRAFHDRFYGTNHLVVAAAGKLDHDQLCRRLETLFPKRSDPESLPERIQPKIHPSQVYLCNHHFEQVNFCLNFAGVSLEDPKRHSLTLLSTLLGGGMSSRLFQSIREDRGLAYHVGTFHSAYSDCGQFTVYGGCSPENFDEVMAQCMTELRKIKDQPVSDKELDRAREQCASSLVMSLESTSSRASALARDLMCNDRIFDIATALEELASVRAGDLQALAGEILTDDTLGLSALGRFEVEAPASPWSVA